MGAALSLVAFSCSRIAFGHPDVTFSKAERDSLMRENDDSAEKHHEHWVREHVRQRNGETQIMPGQWTSSSTSSGRTANGRASGPASAMLTGLFPFLFLSAQRSTT